MTSYQCPPRSLAGGGRSTPSPPEGTMRIVDLSMTVEEWDSTPFAPEEAYFKLRPIVRWEDKGFVSNMVEMTVHAGTHIDSPHHFVRDHPGVAELPVERMLTDAVVLDRTILPRVVFQIENLINLDRIPSKVKLIALPAKWRSESAPARVLALVDED